jgi:hypothetical protein
MNEAGMLKPALIGGILLGVLSSLPYLNFPCCCCVWIIGGGVLAAYIYVRESAIPVTLGRGVALGLFSGIIGTIISALFLTPRYLINKTGMIDQIRHNIDQMPNLPAETRQMVSTMLAREGMVGMIIVVSFLFMIAAYCILALMGGAIGVALFEKRTRDSGSPQTPVDIEPPADIPPPPPPSE